MSLEGMTNCCIYLMINYLSNNFNRFFNKSVNSSHKTQSHKQTQKLLHFATLRSILILKLKILHSYILSFVLKFHKSLINFNYHYNFEECRASQNFRNNYNNKICWWEALGTVSKFAKIWVSNNLNKVCSSSKCQYVIAGKIICSLMHFQNIFLINYVFRDVFLTNNIFYLKILKQIINIYCRAQT